jgi:hypothetical protein
MKTFTKKQKKALLHRASFAVLAVLCCTVFAQTPAVSRPTSQLTSQAASQPASLPTSTGNKTSFEAEQKAAQTQYASAVQFCDSKLAPAQCKRQAGLDYKQVQHDIKLRREAADVATKQAKHDKSQAEKAQNTATAKQGLDAAGKPLERAPLTKPHPQKKSPTQPLSKQEAAKKPAASKSPMAKKETPKAQPTAPKKPLVAQPTPEQRRANVAMFAKKETDIAARKAQAQSKQAKRAAKDAQRRQAGYAVDKP